MTQTLKREVRKTVEKVLNEWGIGADQHDVPALASEITDKIMELPFFKKPAFDEKQADPAWQILFGNRTQADVDQTQFMEDALHTFERDLKLPAMNWYPNRRAEETAMAVLRNLVITEFKKDRSIFQKYETWRRQPFVRGAVSNVTITRTPEQFVSSWSDFRAANPESKPAVETSVDDDGIPETY